MFRVKAVNELGESEPLVTEKETLAKDPWGECKIHCSILMVNVCVVNPIKKNII